MSKRQVIMLLGVWVMAFLFLGFPAYIDEILSVIVGLSVVIIAYNMNIDNCSASDRENNSNNDLPFVDHRKDSINNPS